MNWQQLVNLALQLIPQFIPLGQYPLVAQALAALAAYDHNTVKWVQGALNQLVHPNPPLVVDGLWGPKTKAAVEQFESTLGIQAGGVLSNAIVSGLQTALQKLPAT